MTKKRIDIVFRENSDYLISIPGVVGTAQGGSDSEPCIKVFVVKKTPELEQKIPQVIEGFKVVLEETGVIRAL